MSQTSHLARHPFGAAVDRLSHPAGASGGGGEGWPIPLVGQSEPRRRCRHANSSEHRVKNIMAFARGSCVLISLAAGLAAALWLCGIMHPVSLMDASTIAHAVAVVATSVVAMVATAIGALMVSDRQTDVQSRHDWAQLGLTPAQVSVAVELTAASDIDPRYLTSPSEAALRQVFRAYRAAAQMTHSVPGAARSAKRPSAQPVPDQMSDAGAASDADVSKRASPKAVGTRPAAGQASWKSRRREKAVAGQLRLVANGAGWPRWTTRTSPPAARVVEVIVLSASQDHRAQPQPDASVDLDSADRTARPGCRGPPQVVARRREATGSTIERRWGGSANASSDDIIVRDDLGPQIPVCAAEVEVIETYLGRLLDDLLASSTAKPGSDKG